MPEMMVSRGFRIHMGAEGGVLADETVERLGHLGARLVVLGVMARESTGSGTNMEDMEQFSRPSVKVSPEKQSTPKRAMMSPAVAC